MTDSRCQCGFVFDASATTGSFQASEIALQEAEVYAEYLQVRMRQAQEAAEVAISDQARSPDDAAKSSTAAEANAEYKAAKAEYDEQMKIVVQLRNESRATMSAEAQKAQQAAWARAAEQARAAKAKKAETTSKATKPAAPTVTPKTEKAPAKVAHTKAQPSKAPVANVGQSTPPPAMKQKLADAGESAINRARQQKPVQKGSAPVTHRAKKKQQPEKPKTVVAASTSKPVAPLKPVAPTEKECPNCTAQVALTIKECKCGFSFAQGSEKMDGIGLSEEDRALLGLFSR